MLGVQAGLAAFDLHIRPPRPRAGRVLTASVRVMRLETGDTVRSGTIRCGARIAGRALRLLAKGLRGGRVICAWRIPKWAREQFVRGSVGLRQGQLRVERRFSKRVRR